MEYKGLLSWNLHELYCCSYVDQGQLYMQMETYIVQFRAVSCADRLVGKNSFSVSPQAAVAPA